MFTLLLLYIITSAYIDHTWALCGDSIRWSHRVKMDDVYGVWYAVGYAQHTPDMTNKPNEVGCVTLHIMDATYEIQDNWLDWSIQRKKYSANNWRSSKSNPWSELSMAGSWLDVRLKRNIKRSLQEEKRVRVLWDEDGHTMEQIYVYYQEEPGFWTAEILRPLEREMTARGIDVWYPDDPPRHPDVIKILMVTPNILILNHCSEVGAGGIFSLIMRRSPSIMHRLEWYKYQQYFYKFELPKVYRYSAVCAACTKANCITFLIICFVSLCILW